MVRFKNRYLLFELLQPIQQSEQPASTVLFPIAAEHAVSVAALDRLIRESISNNFGDYGIGVSSTGLQVKYYNPRTGVGILRTPRDHFRLVWAALTFIQSIRNKPCIIRVIHVGGTIRSTQTRAIAHNRNFLLQLANRNQLRSDELAAEATRDEQTILSVSS